MDGSFGVYIERLQLMAFFAGYPLIYAIVNLLKGKGEFKNSFPEKAFRLMPFSYALSGVLFLGYFLKILYPDYSFQNISTELTLLKLWALLSLLFWLKPLSKRPLISLLHSFVFFYFLLKDLFMYSISSTGVDIIRNDMKVYFDSILLNTVTLLVIITVHFLIKKIKK